MAYREVIDDAGTSWQVWDVIPGAADKRASADGPPPTATGERRKARSARVRVSPAKRDGWLAMKCDAERRRIAPIPEGWQSMTDDELLKLIDDARSEGKPRRLIE